MPGAATIARASVGLVLASLGCSRAEGGAVNEPRGSAKSAAASVGETPAAPEAAAAAAPPPSPKPAPAPRPRELQYAWLSGARGVPEVVDALDTRIAPPPGFERVSVEPKSFAGFLRGLPLAGPDAPVLTFRGNVLHAATDPRIAAVVALDVGQADLQQCADAVMRLHAEWLWARGERTQSYRAAAGIPLPYERYRRGERLVAEGSTLRWQPSAPWGDDYATFRRYLDAVFAWANTVSLERQASAVTPTDVMAGDFFILPGNPGHAVLILDIAERGGERVALIGQSFMPAQSFQVLRPKADAVWFTLDPNRDVATPFWRPFPWSSLRRLPS